MSKILATLSAFKTFTGTPEASQLPTIHEPAPIVQAVSGSEKAQAGILASRKKVNSKFEKPKEADIVECQPDPNKVYTDKKEIYEVLGFGNTEKFGPVDMYIFQAEGKSYFRIHHKNSPEIYSNFEFTPIYSLESVQIIYVRSTDPKTGKSISTMMRINNSEGQFRLEIYNPKPLKAPSIK